MPKLNVWRVAVVAEQPSLTMVRWSIVETDLGTRHLVGFCLENAEGRASSAIVRFDPETLRCNTFSGRVYQLQGPPGYDDDGAYVWECWSAINGIQHSVNITYTVLDLKNNQGEGK